MIREKAEGLLYTLYKAYKQTIGTGAFVLPCKGRKAQMHNYVGD